MTETTRDEVEEVLFGFLQRCFIGAALTGTATTVDARWVRSTLGAIDALSPAEVGAWPRGKQLALYELLRDVLIRLRLRPDARFPAGELDGSSSERLSQPLLSGLASAPLAIFR